LIMIFISDHITATQREAQTSDIYMGGYQQTRQ